MNQLPNQPNGPNVDVSWHSVSVTIADGAGLTDVDVEHIDDKSNPPDSGFEEKKVRFNLQPKIYTMRAWGFAYEQARKGEWEEIARDRARFRDKIKQLEPIFAPILDSDHRKNIYNQRM